ncbi:MAG: DNA primase [Acidimicrobiales bacterium]|jgi:DNA primase
MAIPDEDVALVRSSTDIVALIGEYTPLKRVGRRYVGLCPFHSEKSGSFSVNAEEGLYYCFGCQASGDPITFLRAIEGCTFVEAVERLASRAGVSIRNDAEGPDREARDRRQALYDAMEKAVAFYHDRLLKHPDAAQARQYLRSRGLNSEIVRRFRLGWAPEGGNELVRNVKALPNSLAGAGLVVQGNYGPRDSFRGRVIFPIFQTDGKAVALGGRLVPGIGDGQGPKYRNSPETPIYQKRSTLYALNLSRQSIVQTGEVIVCEGYTDVIGFFRVGLPRAVATCGTALTEDHFKLLARFGRRIILAFDADVAGESAAARFYEWERRHEIEVAVADLPKGRDPGDLASSDPDRLRAAIENAKTYLEFRVRRELEAQDLRNPEARARAAEAAIGVVAEHPNELVRDQYLVQVADRTRIDLEQLRPLLATALVRQRAPQRGPQRAPVLSGGEPPPRDEDAPPDEGYGYRPGGPGSGSPAPRPSTLRTSPGQRAGRDALALAIHEPATMAARLDAGLFVDPLQQQAFRALAAADSLHKAIEHADDEVARLLVELATSDPEIGADQVVVALVRATTQDVMADLEAEVREAQTAGDEERLLATVPLVAWLKSELEVFSEVGAGDHPPRAVIEAADRLVAWLAARGGEEG